MTPTPQKEPKNASTPQRRRGPGRPRNSDVDGRTPSCTDREFWIPYGKEVRIALSKGPLTPEELIKELRYQLIPTNLTRHAICWAEIEGWAYWAHGKWWTPKKRSNGNG